MEQHFAYLNPKQLYLLYNYEALKKFSSMTPAQQIKWYNGKKERQYEVYRKQRRWFFIGGRGAGKTRVLGHKIKQMYMTMPRATIGLASLTYGQLLNNTLSEVEKALNDLRIHPWYPKLGGHYVVGQRPPNTFSTPLQPAREYKYLITFHNGFTIQLMSSEAGSHGDVFRGKNTDGILIDEAGFLSGDWVDRVLSKTIRANSHNSFYTSNPLHKQMGVVTSMPWDFDGQWPLRGKEIAKKSPETHFYMESTAVDNIDILGEDYIENERLSSSPLVFAVEVMNKKILSRPDGFYPGLGRDNFKAFVYDYTETEAGVLTTKKHYNDYNPRLPLEFSFDFNNYFTFLAVSQLDHEAHELRFIKEFFVYSNDLRQLIDKAMQYFSTHAYKRVDVYGDRNGYNYDLTSGLRRYDRIKQLILDNYSDYRVNIEAVAANIEHDDKYDIINDALRHRDTNRPRIIINKQSCKSIGISLRLSRTDKKFKKVQKDKSSETKIYIRPEEATHPSDCFDYRVYPLFAGKHYNRYDNVPQEGAPSAQLGFS